MQKEYFVLDLAHSLHGQVKRIRISYKLLGIVSAAVLAICLVLIVLFSSYLQMTWKARKYEHLAADFDRLRARYTELQHQSSQHQLQMASLESLASEVSAAYGIHPPTPISENAAMDSDNDANLKDSIKQYTFLQSASYSSLYHSYAFRWQTHNTPSLWPLTGVLRSSFGSRSDPFSGEGAFHTGVDLQAAPGTPVSVTADGVVESAGWSGRYGKLVVVNHGNGIETCYAHLSQFRVVPGQAVRQGEQIALSGSSGHVTGPHLHYEVRIAGTPVNPYRYMAKAPATVAVRETTANDLGL